MNTFVHGPDGYEGYSWSDGMNTFNYDLPSLDDYDDLPDPD
jgi:hypothetical protein